MYNIGMQKTTEFSTIHYLNKQRHDDQRLMFIHNVRVKTYTVQFNQTV